MPKRKRNDSMNRGARSLAQTSGGKPGLAARFARWRAAPVSPAAGRWRAAGLCLLVMGLVFALYAVTVRYDYVTLDDPMYVENNPMVNQGFSLHGLKLAFTTAPENYWAPLLWMSFMLDMEFSRGAPWSCHLTNTILFSLNAGLLFLLIRRWTGRAGAALAVALLWAFHPARVESVAWITARKDVLSGVFFFAGLWFYQTARAAAQPSGAEAPARRFRPSPFLLLVWLCMLVGGMAKQIVIIMPAAMVLLDIWPLGRTDWNRLWKDLGRLVAEKWAFWVVAMVYASLPILFHVETKAVLDVPIWHRALMIPVHYLFYLSKVIWPVGLMPLHPDLPSWWELLTGAALVLAGLTWLAWRGRRRHPLVLWGWLWFAVLLFPLSGVVWAGAERVASRWLYLPQIGLLLAAVVWAADTLRARRRSSGWAAAACALLLAVWGVLSFQLSWNWRSKDHFGIWVWTCNPENPVTCMLAGDAFLSQRKWDRALDAYEAGSGFWDLHCFLRLCMIWNCCGFPELSDDAWLRFEQGIQKPVLDLLDGKSEFDRQLFWRLRGQSMQARGDFEGAAGAFKEAVALEKEPTAFAVAEYLRACHDAGLTNECAEAAERMSKAAGESRRTWGELFPCYAQIWRDGARGYAYGYFLEHAERFPTNAVAFNNMAWLLATAKPSEVGHARMEEWPAKAVEWAELAVKLDGGKAATAWDTLGAARANAGDFAGAIEAATRGARLAGEGGGKELASQIHQRLKEYRAQKAWRE